MTITDPTPAPLFDEMYAQATDAKHRAYLVLCRLSGILEVADVSMLRGGAMHRLIEDALRLARPTV